ncbi:hypothetical protein D3C81_1223050 [compost metagenome]
MRTGPAATRTMHGHTPAIFQQPLQLVRISGRNQILLHTIAYRPLEFPLHARVHSQQPVTGRDKNLAPCLPGRALLLRTDVARKVFPVGLSLVKNDRFNFAYAGLHGVGLQGVPDVLLQFLERMIVLRRQDSSPEADDELPLLDVNRGTD